MLGSCYVAQYKHSLDSVRTDWDRSAQDFTALSCSQSVDDEVKFSKMDIRLETL